MRDASIDFCSAGDMVRKRKREVFHGIQVQPPIFAPAMASGMAAELSKDVVFTVPAYQSGDMLINIPPLKKFKAGDKVRVTVELERGKPDAV